MVDVNIDGSVRPSGSRGKSKSRDLIRLIAIAVIVVLALIVFVTLWPSVSPTSSPPAACKATEEKLPSPSDWNACIAAITAAINAPVTASGYGKAVLPSPGTAGRLARVTDDVRGLWMDQGSQWFPLNGKIRNIHEYGARCDGTTDDTAAIQLAANELKSGDALYIPPTPDGAFCKITSAISLPRVNGVVVFGAGIRTSRIRQVAPATDAFDTNNTWLTSTNGYLFRDFSIEGINAARYGIRLVATNRAHIVRVYLGGFIGGAGLYTEDSLVVTVEDCEFDGNRDGIMEIGGANTGPNGWRIVHNIFENQTRYGVNLYGAFGVLFAGNTVESNARGGVLLTTAGGGVDILGNYFEQNRGGSGSTFDLFIGSAASFRGGTIESNYFNGRAATDATDYYPIRMKHAQGWHVANNFVNVGSRFLTLEAGANVTDSDFGPQAYGSAFTLTEPTTVYGGIPASFLTSRNRVTDTRVVPSDGANFIVGDMPYGGWRANVAGAGTWTRSADAHNGRPVGVLQRADANPASISQGWSLSEVKNARARGRWVAFSLDVYASSTKPAYFSLTLDNGASGSSAQFTATSELGWATYTVVHRFAASDSTMRALFTADSRIEYRLANPRVFVGLDPHGGIAALSSVPYWAAPAAPTGGTWLRGDVVWNSAPSAGGPSAWVCILEGTPGTWKSLGTLAP